jgi:WhiB family redox-sensing transcriptional regulator
MIADLGWMDAMACRDEDPELFFSESHAAIKLAKAVCAGCPVITECLADAVRRDLRHGVESGIAGGLTAAERASAREARVSEAGRVLEVTS